MSTIANGPPGLEVVHQWNGFSLNDRAERPSRIRLDRIQGWLSGAEIEDSRFSKGRRGEFPLPAYKLGKTVVYEGRVQGKTLDGMRAKYNALKGAFWDIRSELPMILVGTQQWRYTARLMQFDGDDEQVNGWEAVWPFSRGFTIGLRMSDARLYAWPNPLTSGGHLSAADVNVVNQGITDTDPEFIVDNVVGGSDVQFWSGTLGIGLRFLALPAGGGQMIVNFAKRTATLAGVDVSGYIDETQMDWWLGNTPGMLPGNNNITVTAPSAAAPAPAMTWSVSFYHAAE